MTVMLRVGSYMLTMLSGSDMGLRNGLTGHHDHTYLPLLLSSALHA